MNIITSPLKYFVNYACTPVILFCQMQFCDLYYSLIFWAVSSAAGPSRPRIMKNFGTGNNNLIMADFADVPTGISLEWSYF